LKTDLLNTVEIMAITTENVTFSQNVRKETIAPYREDDAPWEKRLARPTVSVIIPTLNEEENIPLVIPFLPLDWIDEVILVDGRSTDNTIEVAKELLPSIKVVLETRKGKGLAMYSGYQAATGDILVVIDADGSHDPREIPRYIMALIQGADFAKGSRFAPGGGTTDMPRFRQFGNAGFVLLSDLLFNIKFTDLCYGYHAFWRYCLDNLDLGSFGGFEIDTALYLQAIRNKLRVVEVPSFEGYRFYGVGKLQTIPDGLRVLRTIFHEWLASLRENQKEMYLGFRGSRSSGPIQTAATHSKILFNPLQDRLRFLGSLIAKLSVDADMRSILKEILQVALDSVGASSASLIFLDENGDVRSEDCFLFGNEGQLSQSVCGLDVLQQGLAGWVVKNRQPALVMNTSTDPRWLRRTWDEQETHSRSALALPLTRDDHVVGVLTLTRPQPKTFTDVELQLLQNIALGI
jgi:glycosyltransferase involved in cell wall biosynthesis